MGLLTAKSLCETHLLRSPTKALDDLALHLQRKRRFRARLWTDNEWSCVSHDDRGDMKSDEYAPLKVALISRGRSDSRTRSWQDMICDGI